jgi:ankyrin repeat protein
MSVRMSVDLSTRRSLYRRAAQQALAVAVGMTLAVTGASTQGGEDVVLLRIGGAAEDGDTARFDATLAEWRNAGRYSLAALDRKGALHLAAHGSTPGHTVIVEKLLALGVDPNAPSGLPRYPLHLAASVGNLATVETLLRHDARIGVVDEDGQSVLHAAVESGATDAPAIVTRLLALRADLDARNIWGQTPLHWAAWHDAKTIPMLVGAGASLEAMDRTGRTPLLVAHGDGIAALLAAGANPRATDTYGNTAVHWAAVTGAGAVRRLLDVGLAPDVPNATGLTPLHFAVLEGGNTLASIELLLARGANPNTATTGDYLFLSPWLNPRANQPRLVSSGSTPLAIARVRHEETKWSTGGYPPVIEALEQHGADAPARASAPLFIPLGFATMALFVVGLLHADARTTGWTRIAARHAAPSSLDGTRFARQDADVGTIGFIRVRNVMRAAALDTGLYLAMPAVARLGHKPLLVPWTEMRVVKKTDILGRAIVRLSVGSPQLGTITLRGGVAEEARRRATRSELDVESDDR